MKGEKLKQELFSLLAEKGAKLMGAGDLSGIISGEMKTGVSVAVPVPGKIVRDLQTAPTKEYYDAYYALNAKLDEIVSCGKRGIRHMRIPQRLSDRMRPGVRRSLIKRRRHGPGWGGSEKAACLSQKSTAALCAYPVC